MVEDDDKDEDEETDGSDEDVCGVAVSITSPEEPEDPEGNRNSMSPCLPNINTVQKRGTTKWMNSRHSAVPAGRLTRWCREDLICSTCICFYLLDLKQAEGLVLGKDFSSFVSVQVNRKPIGIEPKLFGHL